VNEFANIISQLNRQQAAIDRAITALREVEGAKAAQTASPGEAPQRRPQNAAPPKELLRKSQAKRRTLLRQRKPREKATKKAAALPAA